MITAFAGCCTNSRNKKVAAIAAHDLLPGLPKGPRMALPSSCSLWFNRTTICRRFKRMSPQQFNGRNACRRCGKFSDSPEWVRSARALSEPLVYAVRMIDLGTLAGLREHGHELHAYCLACDRWAAVDLDALIGAGYGERRLPITARCRVCREPGQLQVRPPVPAWTNTNGWMAVP